MRPLYDALRSEVLSLDPCVTEEFRKVYVTFKAEATVVDVYPQKTRLRLILNMPFAEVSDPRGCCKDMTGSKLNGDIEVGLKATDELPYVMSLVRQAYAHQLAGESGN
jgi:predicted transport protein